VLRVAAVQPVALAQHVPVVRHAAGVRLVLAAQPAAVAQDVPEVQRHVLAAQRALGGRPVLAAQRVPVVQPVPAMKRVAEERPAPVVQHVLAVQHVSAVKHVAAGRCVLAVLRVALEKRATEVEPSVQFLSPAWPPSSARSPLRALPRPVAWQQLRSAGVRRSPWHTRICRPLRSARNAPGRWSEPCAGRDRQPAQTVWQRAEFRPGRRYKKRGCC